MLQRALLKRVERMERQVGQAAKTRSKFSPDCICFPETERPFFGSEFEQDIAFRLKCPLHGDRFEKQFMGIYVSQWLREKERLRIPKMSARFQKAWAATFPQNLWPAEEEATDAGICLRLKDGTQLLVAPKT